MGGNSPEPNRPPGSDPPRRTDDGGAGLFELTERPVVEYEAGADGYEVRRVNTAFVETFGVDAARGDRLATVLTAVIPGADENAPLLGQLAQDESRVLTRQCETAAGLQPFRVRTLHRAESGYITFTEAVPDSRVSVLEYLTHSLRNPLEVAAVNTEVVSETEQFDYLETVQSAHDRMEAIISDARQLARQGTVVDETAPVDIGVVAKNAWETTTTGAATLEIDDPGAVIADESWLTVLFENLFRNAVRHGTPADRAADEGVTVTVAGTAEGFAVADDGTGIPEGQRGRVLEAGYTTDDDGTGLGLAIVSDIAEGHGWTVSVSGSPGGGTRFEFTDTSRPDGDTRSA